MTSSTRIRARSFGSRPDRIRLLITLSEIEPTGWPLCMTCIWENFQRRISFNADSSGIFGSIRYYPKVRSREGLRRHVRHSFSPPGEPGRQKPYMERGIHAAHPSEDFRGAEHLC